MNNHRDYKFAFAYMVLLLLALMAIPQFSHAQAKPSKPAIKRNLTQELTQAQIVNQKAQTGNRDRVNESDSELKSIWQKIVDIPADLVTAVGAVIAALFTVFSFAINFRATQRNQRDTQFYEALKRFGDASPAIRSSSTGLLSQMAQIRGFLPSLQLLLPRKLPLESSPKISLMLLLSRPRLVRHHSYFETALNQLVSGSCLENDLVVFMSIKDAIMTIMYIDTWAIIEKLYQANLTLQRQLVYKLARYFAAQGIQTPEEIAELFWERASQITGYGSDVLKVLISRPVWRRTFGDPLHASAQLWNSFPEKEVHNRKEETQEALGMAASRLRENVELMSFAILCNKLQCLELENAFLVGAYLGHANLEEASLIGVQLQGATLDWSDMRGAKLAQVTIDSETKITGANWWAANFFYIDSDKYKIDEYLLDCLYQRNNYELVHRPNERHKSVKEFMKKRQEEQAKQASEQALPNDKTRQKSQT